MSQSFLGNLTTGILLAIVIAWYYFSRDNPSLILVILGALAAAVLFAAAIAEVVTGRANIKKDD
ncbi:hypothetical protein FC83_GL003119 [Agrilactobacillus composti DSM 18527 = JCM 14202]|jgi:zinc transporter ZupT|uniref:Uncharacterized protein n=1 Tax=Agrilactobacillus composti DSM 18527 = JCM 14202 TaxID=1423734 RepID=X0PNV2_9LACO|nr:hypothetical protein [Agrilactobacillus composti]KRM33043.1 hypothetical protein FC83_GL003119 [Agrilactobacillus composti DSM 18527 = JCM 14202]MCH4171480.1 hypothetical protein [Lactobacillus sp.]GAF38611.1 hypothetical protein JCM14202_429 [Agrilactobacillus composti DSM 18527 = JCM 14202]